MDALSDRSGPPSPLPLVGRSEDLDVLNGVLADGPGSGPVTFLTGEGGIGKSRLIRVLTDDAGRRGWTVAYGRAFPMERGVPYALLTDAFLPLIREMDSATVTVLSRGTERDLARLFPPLDLGEEASDQEEDPAERKSRIHWHFTEFVLRLGERQPLLLVLEDLQWADPSSLELLHFLARRIESGAVRILASYNSDDRDGNGALVGLERSLVSMRKLRLHPLRPLDRRDTAELVTSVFRVSGPPVLEFADLLYGWTRGNPFFIEQTLESLVVAGRLHRRDGVWLGWELRELELPSTILDAIEARLGRLSEEGRRLAEVLAVTGGRAPVPLLGTLLETPGPDLSASIEELAASGLVDEEEESGTLALEFGHPLIRETLTQRMSLVRTRRLHEQIALALERFHGEAAERHADELAYHFSRAGGPSAPRAVRYLVMAGREALRRHADREAAEYLQAGVHQLRELQAAGDVSGSAGLEDLPPLHVLRGELARALARSGRHEPAGKIWHDLAEEARKRGAAMDVAEALRHLGLLCFWTGRHREAIGHYDAALEAAGSAARHLRARIDLAAGVALQELGEPDAARKRIARALAVAEELSDPGLMARVHRASALVATWSGRPARARSHASQAIELAREAGDLHVEFWARWALAALEGLVGDVAASASQLDEARTLAEELHSPVLGLSVSELAVELCSATGDWDEALAQGERAISVATALNQHGVL
ncbi:MAG: AAA family ATPase, partial [Gemmatimonadetes bacterium]|nr:AAA family ATPase [Gemmatimonadota bacterium]